MFGRRRFGRKVKRVSYRQIKQYGTFLLSVNYPQYVETIPVKTQKGVTSYIYTQISANMKGFSNNGLYSFINGYSPVPIELWLLLYRSSQPEKFVGLTIWVTFMPTHTQFTNTSIEGNDPSKKLDIGTVNNPKVLSSVVGYNVVRIPQGKGLMTTQGGQNQTVNLLTGIGEMPEDYLTDIWDPEKDLLLSGSDVASLTYGAIKSAKFSSKLGTKRKLYPEDCIYITLFSSNKNLPCIVQLQAIAFVES
jgi:hypothetical protein